MKTGNEVNEIIIDGMSESYVINNLVQGVRYSYTIMARDSINRNGIESPPVEFIVDSKYTLLYTLIRLHDYRLLNIYLLTPLVHLLTHDLLKD